MAFARCFLGGCCSSFLSFFLSIVFSFYLSSTTYFDLARWNRQMGADELILMTTSLRTGACGDCWDFNRLFIINIDRLLDTFFLSTKQFLVPNQHRRSGKGTHTR
jgi:hypothetical protein